MLIGNKNFPCHYSLTYLLLRSICGTGSSSRSMQTSLQCLSTIHMVFSDEEIFLIKSLYLKAYTATLSTVQLLGAGYSRVYCTRVTRPVASPSIPDLNPVDYRVGSHAGTSLQDCSTLHRLTSSSASLRLGRAFHRMTSTKPLTRCGYDYTRLRQSKGTPLRALAATHLLFSEPSTFDRRK